MKTVTIEVQLCQVKDIAELCTPGKRILEDGITLHIKDPETGTWRCVQQSVLWSHEKVNRNIQAGVVYRVQKMKYLETQNQQQ